MLIAVYGLGVGMMRALPEAKLFSTDLIDDMHTAFEAVCSKLGLAPTSDRATELVVTKIVELANAGRRGDDLAVETLRFFDVCEARAPGISGPRPAPSVNARVGDLADDWRRVRIATAEMASLTRRSHPISSSER